LKVDFKQDEKLHATGREAFIILSLICCFIYSFISTCLLVYCKKHLKIPKG